VEVKRGGDGDEDSERWVASSRDVSIMRMRRGGITSWAGRGGKCDQRLSREG